MAGPALLAALCEETTCPICLEPFRQPVTLDCGHNFCRGCLCRYWAAFAKGAACPQCREPGPRREFRPNRQLANVTEIARKLDEEGRRAAGRRDPRGPRDLFRTGGEALACVACGRAREHRDRRVVSAAAVAPQYQEFGSTLTRYGNGQEKQLAEHSPRLEERHRFSSEEHPTLQEAIENCQVNVTLDPDTANPFLILSEDLKSVRRGRRRQDVPDTPGRFDLMMCVLGQKKFTSGRYWWEVEVEGNSGRWAVGVARESVRRKGLLPISPDQGLWAVGQSFSYSSSPCQILAFTSPESTPLNLEHKLRKIRVSLDYGKGCVEFFEANTNDLIFAFLSASFSGEGIHPFFRVWKGAKLKC